MFWMKTPERSRTSRVWHFLVLSPHNSLCDIIMWRHMTSWRDTVTSRCHIIGHVTQIGPAISRSVRVVKHILPWWPWLLTLTIELIRDIVQLLLHTKYCVCTNRLLFRAWTDGQMDTHTHKRTDSSDSMTSTADTGGNKDTLVCITCSWQFPTISISCRVR